MEAIKTLSDQALKAVNQVKFSLFKLKDTIT